MKWGFAGYGRIAGKFEESLSHTDHEIVAIASRSGYDKVKAPTKAYDNYDDLFTDKDVEIVYINTTHNSHAPLTIAALNAGKHVLCEKPISISHESALEMVEAAKRNNRFLMEAVWSRFLPGYRKVMDLISQGAIGEVKQISADFGFRMNPEDPKERLIDPALAAGAIWDVGIYPISLAQDIFKDDPIEMSTSAVLSPLNVEDRCAILLGYGNQRIAQLSCAIDLNTINDATITGTKGHIVMKNFWMCESFKVIKDDGEQSYELPMTSNGLYHEAIACADYIRQGLTESPYMSWDHSLQLAKIMDQAIKQCRS